MVDMTPRKVGVYTRHPDLHVWHATSGVLTSLPTKRAKIGMRVKTLSDRRHNFFFACLDVLRRELVKDNKNITKWPLWVGKGG